MRIWRPAEAATLGSLASSEYPMLLERATATAPVAFWSHSPNIKVACKILQALQTAFVLQEKVRKLKYFAPYTPTMRRAREHNNLSSGLRHPARLRARLATLHLMPALLFLAAILLAPASFAQSGRKTQSTNPSSTQRPRRATATTSTDKAATKTQSSSTQTPVSVVLDEAPPPPPSVKPKAPPKATAANEPDEEVGPEDIVRITSNLVTVPASVVDAYGRALTGLKLEDFELRVDGQVKSISDISYSDTPVRLALLFDNSSSLVSAREFEKQAAIRFFRAVMRPADQAAVYNVYTEVVLAQPLTSNVNALVRTIENFGKPEGATRLFDAIAESASYLRPQPGRKVIVIVSDGEDTLSDIDFDEALRKAQAADCQIYAVQTKQIEYMMQTGQPMGSANLRALAAERRLQEFAAQTGGAVYSPLAVGELDAAFAQISADLAQQYVLSYYPTDERLDGRFRSISLRVLSHPTARVRARKGYYASRAAMKSSVNWQTSSANDTGVSGISPSDTVPKDANQNSAVASISPNAAGLTTTSENRMAAPVASLSPQPSPAQPTPVASQSTPPPKSEPAAQNIIISSSAPKVTSATEKTTELSQPPPPKTVTPAETAQPSPTQKAVSGGVLNGKALNLPKPDYPLGARNSGASGTVIVEVTVDESGKVIAARVTSGHPLLRAAAIAAARQARFAPTKLSGQPVKVTGVITYNFVVR